ncbi:MAG: FKBP-type peptidyl-prolyl cis-trans isomerase [Actinomycetota bacterium]
MRIRLIGSLLAGTLLLAACGGSDDADTTGDPEDAAAAPETADSETGDDDRTTADDETDDGGTEVESAEPPTPTDGASDKPDVEIPTEIPTELVRTVLDAGSGAEAAEGDTVIVDYVGVRSRDGVEFDASYDRGEPFPLTLGNGGVIQGWEDGLLGAQAGERVQLDIPSDLAYGESSRGEVIGENEALTFVIDVRAVIPVVTAEDVPADPGVPLSEGATETTFVDLVDGDGETLERGDTALIRYVNFRGDNGVAIDTSWIEPVPIPYDEGILPGILTGLDGIQIGGRRAITIPPEDGFGPDGLPQQGLPAGADTIFVIELAAIL